MASKLWPYEQAEKALARFGKEPRLLFETGYGPSGLPHIGTFCEVARTSWIRHAVEELFKVKVVRVNTMNVRGKQRRQRTSQAGKCPDWKKAIVTLKEGDKIILT